MTFPVVNIRTLLFSLIIFSTTVSGQEKKLEKSWIKTATYVLPDNEKMADTTYTRYTFNKGGKVYISFYPAWNNSPMTWSLEGGALTIGPSTWLVEELSDSTLTISQTGFRRIVMYAEDYLNKTRGELVQIGEYNQAPLYKANRIVTPRCKKDALRDYIQLALDGYNIKKASYFSVSFVVTKTGALENFQVINSITEGHSADVIRLLKKSGSWTPAMFRGQPVQTQMIYDIKYLDSIVR